MESSVSPPNNTPASNTDDAPTMAILDELSRTTDPAAYDKLYAQLDSVH